MERKTGIQRWTVRGTRNLLLVGFLGTFLWGCEIKDRTFFEPALGDQSLIPDITAPEITPVFPLPNGNAPLNIDRLDFNIEDLIGGNGAVPSGVDPATVSASVGGFNLNLTQNGTAWGGGFSGPDDGIVEVLIAGSDLAGNSNTFSYPFNLKWNDPIIDFSLTPDVSWSSQDESVDLRLEGTITDPYLGLTTGGLYQVGADGLCGTSDDTPWPEGTGPGQVPNNFFDFTGSLGSGGTFGITFQAYNAVSSEGESLQSDFCFRIDAQDTAEDGTGGLNPNLSMATVSSSLMWSRPFTTGSITGTVTLDNEPLGGVTVSIPGASQQTLGDGAYRFGTLDPGPYTVQVSELPENVFCDPNSVDTNVQVGVESVVDFSCSSAPTGSITGTVTLGGEPLAGVTVTAGAATRQTGADGAYQFQNLPVGTYTVQLSDLPADVTCEPASVEAQVEAGQETVVDFACDEEPNFTIELEGSYRHFVGYSRICLVIRTDPAQPGAEYTATAAGPNGGLQGSGFHSGTLDASGEAVETNDINLYGDYDWTVEILGLQATVDISVTGADGSCGF